MNALLPALNSPTTTSRNSSSSWRSERWRRVLVLRLHVDAGQHRAQVRELPSLVGEQGPLALGEDARFHGLQCRGRGGAGGPPRSLQSRSTTVRRALWTWRPPLY
jgi:hypothetical protein